MKKILEVGKKILMGTVVVVAMTVSFIVFFDNRYPSKEIFDVHCRVQERDINKIDEKLDKILDIMMGDK